MQQMTPVCSLRELLAYKFALHECALYLDGHPCDKAALAYYKEMSCIYRDMLARYESEVMPLTRPATFDGECSTWCKTPWPWEI